MQLLPIINNFVKNTGLPQYNNLVSTNAALNADIATLQTTTTDANLATAQADWKAVRTVWEQCEGFLIGPVEAYSYDPNTDT